MALPSILITGCSSGIGYTVAKGLKARGWRVFASCRQEQDVQRLAEEGLECLLLDVADSASIRAAVDEVLARTGGTLDALFNNAGFGQPGAAEDITRAALREQFETNLFGAWELTNAVLPAMRRQGHGRILFNSSVLGFAAMKYRGAYNASKYAMEGLCDTLRLELEGSGIFVSLVEPGPIESRFRPNALTHFLKNVDIEHSAHRASYEKQLVRLRKEGHAAPFTLPPEAVLDAVLKSLQSKRPAARYRVTFPTKLFWYLKRVLPTRALDWVLQRAA
ncbi:SDR family oxidoreductase [Pseudogulbenkiania subflava]|uniref:Short-chain dehydrogenase n=1 Tax=Pseudogulbenkiania subflava DSM 22618 TaxID=1123014 RepID=A0A1Y6C1E2_9NEIS|nr:SDR family oxidoreductase [Pseudogulbenkiania subflava]SMF38654.1 Short-chain dehydrogenase [Pseudogulbenkiania subflava DSM 22618]